MPAKKTTPNKSDFIRQQPASLSAAEVVAKGKTEGIKFSPQLVYNVRNGSKAKKPTAKRTPSTSTAPTRTSARTKSTQSKADFVRAHANLSPKEIVEAAKTAGMKLDVNYVYKVRGADKTAGKKKPAKAAAPTTKPSSPTVTKARATLKLAPPVPRPITTASSAETLLKALGAEIGLGRAIEILQGERARVRAVIGAG